MYNTQEYYKCAPSIALLSGGAVDRAEIEALIEIHLGLGYGPRDANAIALSMAEDEKMECDPCPVCHRFSCRCEDESYTVAPH